jgi:hypothetical protein
MTAEQKQAIDINLKEAPLFLHVYEKIMESLESENKYLQTRETELLFRKKQLENTLQDLAQTIINSSTEQEEKIKLINIVEKAIVIGNEKS